MQSPRRRQRDNPTCFGRNNHGGSGLRQNAVSLPAAKAGETTAMANGKSQSGATRRIQEDPAKGLGFEPVPAHNLRWNTSSGQLAEPRCSLLGFRHMLSHKAKLLYAFTSCVAPSAPSMLCLLVFQEIGCRVGFCFLFALVLEQTGLARSKPNRRQRNSPSCFGRNNHGGRGPSTSPCGQLAGCSGCKETAQTRGNMAGSHGGERKIQSNLTEAATVNLKGCFGFDCACPAWNVLHERGLQL